MKNIINYSLWALCVLILFASCRKQDHFYKDFIADGEIVYVGKADSVKFHPGYNKALLTWEIKDPNIIKMKVYWNTRQDSLIYDVNRTNQADSIGVIIDGLDERFYSFEIYSEDIDKNLSIKALAEGQVYGKDYEASLINRPVKNVKLMDNDLIIDWFNPSTNTIGSEIHYIDSVGTPTTKYVPDTAIQSVMGGVNFNESIIYRTLFLPDTLAIDTFYTEFEPIIVN